MIGYLIKVTLIWALLLALYELLYRKSPAYTLNRMYLFLALFTGLLLPLISLPEFINSTSGLGVINRDIQNLNGVATPATTPAAAAETHNRVDIATILWWLYIAGVLMAFVISLREIVLILRTAIYGHYRTIADYRIFSSSKPHAPFSFMGWVFISDPSLYDENGLKYIFRHEDAHNRRWHWLDTILIQLFFVVFWFHPLVWRYRYLLKLNHEYEADYYAAGDNAYDYGHFLLQQTLLKGTPAIAHSFHFSPIKNRINMLTKTGKKSAWKYAMIIPALLGCTLLFAKSNGTNERVRVGDKITFRGHEFLWQPEMFDTILIEDPATGKERMMVARRAGYICMMDRDTIHSNDNPLITPAQFRHNNQSFRDYARALFEKKFPGIPDSIQFITVNNIVIDENGKLRYYDIECTTDSKKYDLTQANSPFVAYGKEIERIVTECPNWLPGLFAGKKIKVSLSSLDIRFKPRTVSGAKPDADKK